MRDLDGFRAGTPLRHLRHTSKRMKIDFRLTTNCLEPFDLLWKVRNTGPDAERANGLRGSILRDDGSRKRTETTMYRGEHYVEAYAVGKGVGSQPRTKRSASPKGPPTATFRRPRFGPKQSPLMSRRARCVPLTNR